jgi:hypothetical protein
MAWITDAPPSSLAPLAVASQSASTAPRWFQLARNKLEVQLRSPRTTHRPAGGPYSWICAATRSAIRRAIVSEGAVTAAMYLALRKRILVTPEVVRLFQTIFAKPRRGF